MTKEEVTSLMDEELRAHIPDASMRWQVVDHLYKITKRAEDDARSDMVPFAYAKHE